MDTGIEGLKINKIEIIPARDGGVMHGLKNTEDSFLGFGEAYFSYLNYGTIKPWRRHLEMTCNIMVIEGAIRFVIYDDRFESIGKTNQFYEITLSPENYFRLTLPPMLWMAFQGKGKGKNILLNIANMLHKPEEMERKELTEIGFKWE